MTVSIPLSLTLLSVTVTDQSQLYLLINFCLAEFAVFYYKDYKIQSDETNDAQPDILTDKIAELQHSNTCTTEILPDNIKLLVTNEVRKCQKIRAVVGFHTPNKNKRT